MCRRWWRRPLRPGVRGSVLDRRRQAASFVVPSKVAISVPEASTKPAQDLLTVGANHPTVETDQGSSNHGDDLPLSPLT